MTLNNSFDISKIKIPTFGRLFKEPLGFAELLNVFSTWPILEGLPEAHGQPVMVIPGLTTGDISTVIIRSFLNSKNFSAYGWELGINLDYTQKLEDKLIDRVDEIAQKHGQKVALIGWSLGGITTRILAKHAPENISQVFSLGGPFTNLKGDTHVSWWGELVAGRKIEDFNQQWAEDAAAQPSMPSTSIYSKTDGMVSWEYCVDWNTGPQTQNIEVLCNHLGFGFNPVVWMIIHDRLMQEEGKWELFDEARILEAEAMSLFHV